MQRAAQLALTLLLAAALTAPRQTLAGPARHAVAVRVGRRPAAAHWLQGCGGRCAVPTHPCWWRDTEWEGVGEQPCPQHAAAGQQAASIPPPPRLPPANRLPTNTHLSSWNLDSVALKLSTWPCSPLYMSTWGSPLTPSPRPSGLFSSASQSRGAVRFQGDRTASQRRDGTCTVGKAMRAAGCLAAVGSLLLPRATACAVPPSLPVYTPLRCASP